MRLSNVPQQAEVDETALGFTFGDWQDHTLYACVFLCERQPQSPLPETQPLGSRLERYSPHRKHSWPRNELYPGRKPSREAPRRSGRGEESGPRRLPLHRRFCPRPSIWRDRWGRWTSRHWQAWSARQSRGWSDPPRSARSCRTSSALPSHPSVRRPPSRRTPLSPGRRLLPPTLWGPASRRSRHTIRMNCSRCRSKSRHPWILACSSRSPITAPASGPWLLLQRPTTSCRSWRG